MNDLDLCLEVVWRSRQPLRYIWLWISRKPLEIEAWFQMTTNRKWHMGYQMVTWPMTSRDLQRSCEAVRSAILATAWLLVMYVFCGRLSASALSILLIYTCILTTTTETFKQTSERGSVSTSLYTESVKLLVYTVHTETLLQHCVKLLP